ncbi:hypothetical protein M407DRAFT_244673 [Tulasnella calospora MUT 4182]|uniref:Uncharacterized protein n=1 Tax=Tulasnella calospora MUT 4182 TaxID=1051891 RepID=A0A0C3LQL5_9AGAM|nr:hypothetical protein M407DRAFT_244673 [Tulasnella calospora MUT 4182]
MSSLLLCILTTALNSLQNLNPRLLGVLVGRPWLSLCLVSLVSLDIGIYVLFLDGAARFLMSPDVDPGYDHSPNVARGHDGAVKTALKVILPPMLIAFALAWG